MVRIIFRFDKQSGNKPTQKETIAEMQKMNKQLASITSVSHHAVTAEHVEFDARIHGKGVGKFLVFTFEAKIPLEKDLPKLKDDGRWNKKSVQKVCCIGENIFE